jgi:hypothetical protein
MGTAPLRAVAAQCVYNGPRLAGGALEEQQLLPVAGATQRGVCAWELRRSPQRGTPVARCLRGKRSVRCAFGSVEPNSSGAAGGAPRGASTGDVEAELFVALGGADQHGATGAASTRAGRASGDGTRGARCTEFDGAEHRCHDGDCPTTATAAAGADVHPLRVPTAAAGAARQRNKAAIAVLLPAVAPPRGAFTASGVAAASTGQPLLMPTAAPVPSDGIAGVPVTAALTRAPKGVPGAATGGFVHWGAARQYAVEAGAVGTSALPVVAVFVRTHPNAVFAPASAAGEAVAAIGSVCAAERYIAEGTSTAASAGSTVDPFSIDADARAPNRSLRQQHKGQVALVARREGVAVGGGDTELRPRSHNEAVNDHCPAARADAQRALPQNALAAAVGANRRGLHDVEGVHNRRRVANAEP